MRFQFAGFDLAMRTIIWLHRSTSPMENQLKGKKLLTLHLLVMT